MRFMMIMIPKVEAYATETDVPLKVEDAEKMIAYNAELQQAGVLLGLDGLWPPATGARVHFTGGEVSVTDGPFAEAKEVVGGYWLIQVKSREEAIEWARRVPVVSHDAIVEVRRLQEMEDFTDEFQQVITRHGF